MVHRMDSIEEFPTQRKLCRRKLKVKSEFRDSGDTDYGFASKKPKFDSSNQENNGGDVVEMLEYDPLEEPSPLGLKLKKSPSFLDLIQMKLSQEKSASLAKTLAKKQKNGGDGSSSTAADNNNNNNNNNKLKASNFPASLLKIGTWEYKSRYEGDLVAKCYFAKHKLVWEVLDGGLKNKIEIQWSDIMAIKANYPDNEPGTLDVVLVRQPSFFREINPQPRKHTLWQATTDFTCGQASLHRRHFLQFPQGTLGKHFQKLIQCDPRLSFLSQQPQIVLETPYFHPRVSIFGDQNDPEHSFEFKTEGRFSFSGIRDTISASRLSSSDIESQNLISSTTNSHQPIPGIYAMEGDVSSKFTGTHGLELLNQIKLPGLHPSMSVGDLVNHIGDCISEQMQSDGSTTSIDETQKSEVLKEITHYLLNDSQSLTISDEKSIMSRVNSLCCLLQKEDTGVQNPSNQLCEDQTALGLVAVGNNDHEGMNPTNPLCDQTAKTLPAVGSEISSGIDTHASQGTGMSRKDSVDELLHTLPRIASLPQFLIPEELGKLAR